jgi:hypothetical protein
MTAARKGIKEVDVVPAVKTVAKKNAGAYARKTAKKATLG